MKFIFNFGQLSYYKNSWVPEFLPGDRLCLPTIREVTWTGEGEFLSQLYRDWSRNLVDDISKPHAKEGEYFLLRYLQMTPKIFAEFTAAHRALEEEFVRRSIQAMRAKLPSLEHVRWMIAADNRSFVTGQRLANLED